MTLLEEMVAQLSGMPEKERAELVATALDATKHMRFVPLPGPQTAAYNSEADVTLYGGQAGSGKSYLIMGLASQEHSSSIIFRRESSQTDGLEKAGHQIIGDSARFNGTDLEWSWPDGRSLKLAGMKDAGDWNKHAGRERDLIGFDEAGEFLREQVSSLMAWNRGPKGQRCRILLASNPPRTADGVWMLEWFAPWIDADHEWAAKSGELRWAAMVDGNPVWVGGPDSLVIAGETYKPLSFTFIRAALADNPYRNTPEYRAKLQSLPEPLRSQLLYGHFDVGQEDDVWQVIPTAWIKAAQARWTKAPPAGIPMCAIGVDVAQGGADRSVLACRHDGWFDALLSVPGVETPDGTKVAGLVISKRRDQAAVIVDVGGGWGGDAVAHLERNGIETMPYLGVKESIARTKDNQLGFGNVRSQAYWQLREALDPEQPGGSNIALPPSKTLMSDLAAPRFNVTGRGIEVTPKKDVIKRLGRSPDEGDAVVMAWHSGPKMASHYNTWRSNNRLPTKAVMHRR